MTILLCVMVIFVESQKMIISDKPLELPKEYLIEPVPYPENYIEALKFHTAMQDPSEFIAMNENDVDDPRP